MVIFKKRLIFLIFILLSAFIITGCCLFFSYYKLIVATDGSGSVKIDSEASEYMENTEVTLTAVADDGWEFSSWSGVKSEDGAAATVLMDMNRAVVAEFSIALNSDNPTDDVDSPPLVGFAPTAEEDWTFMIYLDGDNNLDGYSVDDFNEMEKGLSDSGNANMDIIVLHDRSSDYCGWSDSEDGDDDDAVDSGARMYRLAADNTRLYPGSGYDSVALTSGVEKELNMGDPDVLADFMIYCADTYPSAHYALVLWNHGSGARSINPESDSAKLICQDDDIGSGSGSDYLFMDEVQQALASAVAGSTIDGGLDLIGADACLMGTVETAYELRDYTEVYAASMNNEGVAGWDYEDLFGRMKNSATGTGAEALGGLIVASFHDTAGTGITPTMSAVRTSGLEALKADIDVLAAALYNADAQAAVQEIRDEAVDFFNDGDVSDAVSNPYHDLNDFCYLVVNNADYVSAAAETAASAVLDELARTVISAYAGSGLGNYYGSGEDVKRGLSIFFSKGDKSYNYSSHYREQYWYTDQNLDDILTNYNYEDGNLDFCTSDEDGEVETWRELHEAWYDPFDTFTPGSW